MLTFPIVSFQRHKPEDFSLILTPESLFHRMRDNINWLTSGLLDHDETYNFYSVHDFRDYLSTLSPELRETIIEELNNDLLFLDGEV